LDAALYHRIGEILESARAGVARTINSTQVVANWLIGREIVEEEQHGAKRAAYGAALLSELSAKLTRDFGRGWSLRQLEYCRFFYQEYPYLLARENPHAPRAISLPGGITEAPDGKSKTSSRSTAKIPHAPRAELERSDPLMC
jgi:hypothetical protein